MAMACAGCQAAAVTSDYSNIGSFQTSALARDGVTEPDSADINVLGLNGLGIVGGLNDDTVDSTEFIQFGFYAGTAISVYTNFDGIVGERILEAFDTSGVSPGTVSQSSSGLFGVTALLGNVAISRFMLTSPGRDTFRVNRVTYNAVPISATVWLFSSGLGMMSRVITSTPSTLPRHGTAPTTR